MFSSLSIILPSPEVLSFLLPLKSLHLSSLSCLFISPYIHFPHMGRNRGKVRAKTILTANGLVLLCFIETPFFLLKAFWLVTGNNASLPESNSSFTAFTRSSGCLITWFAGVLKFCNHSLNKFPFCSYFECVEVHLFEIYIIYLKYIQHM